VTGARALAAVLRPHLVGAVPSFDDAKWAMAIWDAVMGVPS
jgi:hypothetical protein